MPAQSLAIGPVRRCILAAAVSVLAANASQAGDRTGEQIWAQSCASCHGAKGEGVPDQYADPLVGDKPVAELARIIDETMPEDDPAKCVGEDAARVAGYLYDAFYSPIAQARNRPARIEFARLTVPQYRNAVADLIATFRGKEPAFGEERGIFGRYTKNRNGNADENSFDRTDATIDFDFGEGSPNSDRIPPEEFTIWWRGAVYAPESGDYEFIVETRNGMQLWVNDMEEPLIDGKVRSGEDVVWREKIRLLGGRYYSLKLEFFKSEKAKEKVAAVRLKWKPPHHAEEVIPQRYLVPQEVPEVLVVTTDFPPDDRSQGYERGTSISKEWDAATTYAALDVAGQVAEQLNKLADLRTVERRRRRGRREETPPPAELSQEQKDENARKVQAFCTRFVERAFRRPLNEEERQFFVDRQFAQAADEQAAVKRVVLLALKSPRFLYRETGADGFDDYDTASWLAFGLWDSIPDQELLDAAGRGELNSREQIAAQAERMLADPRARFKVREFLHQWLNLGHIQGVSKDQDLFPGFDEAIVSDLRTSLDLFLDDVVWSEASDFRQLLIADSTYLNGRLARFFGYDLPDDAPFQKVSFEPQLRAGVLSHPYLMTGFAYRATTSPIHRGVFLAKNVLGRHLNPPQMAVTPVPPDLHPDLNTRERIALQTSPTDCRACHDMINGLGFTLEHFDAVGRYRDVEQDRPIDASGSYLTQAGESVKFSGAQELAAFLANTEETQAAFAEQLFRYLLKQPVQAFGPEQLPELRKSFADSGFSVRRLLVELMAESAVTARQLSEPSDAQAVSVRE